MQRQLNEILLIPQKHDQERDAFAIYWGQHIGQVIRVGKFWEQPVIPNGSRITIYGPDTFSLVLAQILNVSLVSPKDDVLVDLPMEFLKRKIQVNQLQQIQEKMFPVFIKPVTPKLFQAKVYTSYQEFQAVTQKLGTTLELMVSEVISIEKEVRAFVLNQKVLDVAFYEGQGDIEEVLGFVKTFLEKAEIPLPKSYVVDMGYHSTKGWYIIEFNAVWGAGLNGCSPNKVWSAIREGIKI